MVRPANGSGILLTPKNITRGGEECIELLEQMLESAKKGDMEWLVVVAGGAADYGVALAGSNGAQMNLGLDVAKATILERVQMPKGRPASPIMRAR